MRNAIAQNPEAKRYSLTILRIMAYVSDLKTIVELAHSKNMFVLVDEAHGTHFYFGENMPVNAMAAGADLSAVSMHKTGGSLTQSSFLLTGDRISPGHVRQIINLTQTTSGSYLLLTSLDISRRNLAIDGKNIFAKVTALAEYGRTEINKIGGYYAFSSELIDKNEIYDFDPTKLSVHTREIGLAGVEVYDILRDDYNIQIEFGDIGNILAIISVGDRELALERLVSSLSEIKRLYLKDKTGMFDHEYINPEVAITPQQAFYARQQVLPIKKSAGYVSGEFVMAYPPGIPILAPGERITTEIIDYILYAKAKGSFLTGTADMAVENIQIVEE